MSKKEKKKEQTFAGGENEEYKEEKKNESAGSEKDRKEPSAPQESKEDVPEKKPEDRAGEEKITRAAFDEANKKREAAEAALREATDKTLRLAAEFDNYRKRTTREKEAAYGDAFCDAVRELLPVLDSLERAEPFLVEGDKLSDGVRLTLAQFRKALEKCGVEPIDEIRVPFDASVHNAMLRIEDESFGENEVAQILEKGYKKGDRVIRYARVTVANP